jgi:acylphosphatase
MSRHVNITVTGRVQGVGFRYFARSEAFHLGIKGLVRNMPDGSVYIEAEGESDSIDKFIAWCKEGPPHAHIENVSIISGALQYYETFEIVR